MRDRDQHKIEQRMNEELGLLRERSQFRSLAIPAGIDLSSNDYLGLAADLRVKSAVGEAVARATKVGAAGSRLLSGNSPEWEDLEHEFAEFAGTDAALFFGSGYSANLGLLTSVLEPGDIVFSDALNHASLIDGVRLSGAKKIVYPHANLQFLENALREHAKVPGSKLIVTESVFSMEGDVTRIDALLSLALKYRADVVVDEAHATGVCGPQGRGIAAANRRERDVLAIVHTCGKALASCGAFVCGSATLKEYLVNRARTFIFSTALPSYIAGQISAAVATARKADAERDHLARIASLLREGLFAHGFNCGASATHIVPVMLGTNEMALHIASELQRAGFGVKAIRPPTVPEGTARIRLSLTSRITTDEILRLIEAMDAARKSADPASSINAVHV
ncbi:MAG TPA: 8-amino-7-oxononanoate synthase [Candidatus Acidoferrales bacterium]|nr:8-amino-7-oxononanoate synthase [Candidatus Acidoferrales bacterium]